MVCWSTRPWERPRIFFTLNDLNTLEGATLVHGVGLESDTPAAVVRLNNFTNLIGPATDNVAVWFANNPSTFGPTTAVQNNNFNLTIASYGIGIGPGLFPINEPFDGQCNWWGSADGPGPVGPGSGARVSPDVAYSPWAIAPGLELPSFAPGTTSRRPRLNAKMADGPRPSALTALPSRTRAIAFSL